MGPDIGSMKLVSYCDSTNYDSISLTFFQHEFFEKLQIEEDDVDDDGLPTGAEGTKKMFK